MNSKQKVIMVLDTETCDLSGPVYDVGFTICNRKGEIAYRWNALVAEVFTNPDVMTGAYFAKKVFTHYAPMLDAGSISLMPWV